MRIAIPALQQEPIVFDLSFAPGAIDLGEEVRQTSPLSVQGRADLVEEHDGPHHVIHDIRVRANYAADFELQCARCLTAIPQPFKGDFDLIYRPLGADSDPARPHHDDRAISTSETEIGYYQGDGLELEDVLREQVLLALPARLLCSPDCKGFCPHCGQDLNQAQCSCDPVFTDPRWNALADLRTRMKI
jgi:uncharacterized protein